MKTLTDSAIAKAMATAKNTGKPIKLTDEGRLRLLIRPSGSASWQHRYDFNGKEQIATLGSYPTLSIAKARVKRDANRAQLEDGINPMAEKKKEKIAARAASANTFATVAAAYLETRTDLAPRTLKKAQWQLREFLNPEIGNEPIGEITAPLLLAAIRKIEKTGKYETAHKTKELAGRVFSFAIAEGTNNVDYNPAAGLSPALKARPEKHLAALTKPAEVGQLLRVIDGAKDFKPATHAALRLLPHVFLRPGELRGGRWNEIDWDTAQWTVPAGRMKGKGNRRVEHIVPLSRQAVAILKSLEKITGGKDGYMFPAIGGKDRPLSENTLGAALVTLGYTSDMHTPHGFRSTASTLLHELGFLSSDIELQLAHKDKNQVRGIYNRSERIKERRVMMQKWSDHLDQLRNGNGTVASVPVSKKVKKNAAK
jgi:integrase